VKVMDEEFGMNSFIISVKYLDAYEGNLSNCVIILAGIVKGTMTTTHSYTGDQVTVKNSVLC